MGFALSRSPEEISPGDWRKVGQVSLTNPEDLFGGRPGHKWWVVMNAGEHNRAPRIFFNSGKYGTEQMYSLVTKERT